MHCHKRKASSVAATSVHICPRYILVFLIVNRLIRNRKLIGTGNVIYSPNPVVLLQVTIDANIGLHDNEVY